MIHPLAYELQIARKGEAAAEPKQIAREGEAPAEPKLQIAREGEAPAEPKPRENVASVRLSRSFALPFPNRSTTCKLPRVHPGDKLPGVLPNELGSHSMALIYRWRSSSRTGISWRSLVARANKSPISSS
jgi:hypothetical protein